MNWKYVSLFTLLLAISFPAFGQNVHFVNINVSGGAQNGTSWANAFSDLQSALAAASYGDEVWVAQGTYFPTDGTDRYFYLELPDGVALLGGFDGTETTADQRDWQANPTILSGDIGEPGDSTDNSFTILYLEYVDSTTLVDGFTFTEGHAQSLVNVEPGTGPTRSGGAIYIRGNGSGESARPGIRNCRFVSNSARNDGGAIYCNGQSNGSADALIYDCIFEENLAFNGGAIAMHGGHFTEGVPQVTRCEFLDNTATVGGAIRLKYSHGEVPWLVSHCNFEGNIASLGGAIQIDDTNSGAPFLLEDCTFFQNSGGQGPVLHLLSFDEGSEDIHISRCDFDQTIGYDFGSPVSSSVFIEIFPNTPKTTTIQDCRFTNNDGSSMNNNASGAIVVFTSDTLLISNCLFAGNLGFSGSALDLEQVEYAQVSNCTFADNFSENDGSVFQVFGNGFGLDFVNCIFSGNSGADPLNFGGGGANGLIQFEHCAFDVPMCGANISAAATTDVICGAGNLFSTDPLFVDASANDFTLQGCSPCLNSGSNDFVETTTDLAGNSRIVSGTVDMGALETGQFSITLDSVFDAGCQGGNSGGFVISTENGCGPYTLLIGPAGTVSDTMPIVFQGLPAGTFDISIVDANGLEFDFEVTIGESSAFTVEAQVTDVDCPSGTLGSASALVLGGVGDLSFDWSNGGTAPSIENLLPGSYSVTVTDSVGCTAMTDFEVGLAGNITLTGEAENLTCHGSADGSATVLPIDGTAPFTWQWQGGQTDTTITGLSAGIYPVTVTDALGCDENLIFQVLEPDTLVVKILEPFSPLCFGATDGELTSFVVGGTWPYLLDWGNGSTDSLLTGLPAGEYPLMVTDANGCTASAAGVINQWPEILVDATVTHVTGAANADGAIDVTAVSGGVPGYSFEWGNGETTQSVQGLAPGNYSLTVTDDFGCQQVFEFTVEVETATAQVLGGVEFSVFPNPVPTGGQLRLGVGHLRGVRHLDARLFDAFGREISGKKIALEGGLRYLEMPQAAGGYFLILDNGKGEQVVFRLVVQ